MLRVGLVVALAACVPSVGIHSVKHAAPTLSVWDEAPFKEYVALPATTSTRFGPPGPTPEGRPWEVGQWVLYERHHRGVTELELLRIVSQESCGFWIERHVSDGRDRSSWSFCVRSQPSPALDESLWAVIERKNGNVTAVDDFRVNASDRARFGWLVSSVHPRWPAAEVPQENVTTAAGQFEWAYKVTTSERTRWSHPAVPLSGIVKEVTAEDERTLRAYGTSDALRVSTEVARARQQQQEQNERPTVECLTGVRRSPRVCETSPRTLFSLGVGLAGVSRNGATPPLGGSTWRMQLGQRLVTRLHLVEEINLYALGSHSVYPSVTSEEQGSFGAGIRWAPFAPDVLQRQGQAFVPVHARYVDFHALFLTAIIGANVRDRQTNTASDEWTTTSSWSPMASVAVSWFPYQGRDWAFGTEFREQLSRYDGRLQRGWQLLFPVNLHGW